MGPSPADANRATSIEGCPVSAALVAAVAQAARCGSPTGREACRAATAMAAVAQAVATLPAGQRAALEACRAVTTVAARTGPTTATAAARAALLFALWMPPPPHGMGGPGASGSLLAHGPVWLCGLPQFFGPGPGSRVAGVGRR